MRRRIGRHEALLPVRRRAFGVVAPQRFAVIHGIVAEHGAPLSAIGECLPARVIAFDRRERHLLREEGEQTAAAAAGAIFEIKDVSAGLTDEQLHDMASAQ
jgi:hypothetical protein